METLSTLKIDHTKLRAARGKRKAIEVSRLTGIPGPRLSDIERNYRNRRPTPDELLRLCKLYGISIEDLAENN